MELLLVLLWCFWFRRNRAVHSAPLLSVEETVGWSELFLADYQAVVAVSSVRCGLFWVLVCAGGSVGVVRVRVLWYTVFRGWVVMFIIQYECRGGSDVLHGSVSAGVFPSSVFRGAQEGCIESQFNGLEEGATDHGTAITEMQISFVFGAIKTVMGKQN
ncbi:hypothetical protein ACOSQ3_026937 [Xanthoceras sorbifolium]